ncbi:hypothetical protein CWC05_02620 [Pseudoalteromonas ruthenica]|uniref:Uncharacterized protein n=1 Tax=Pseudoalteromonas ruthenica TaxID=151081 RepID=A0A5S3Z9U5_9GAMM|nr:hypothetical protein CWC05_02620 [Pseudoalteromonas ruthenica]
MPTYLVNKRAQSNGDHEVHEDTCNHLPDLSNRMNLGWHADCVSAVREAKKMYNTANGCKFCSEYCHTS